MKMCARGHNSVSLMPRTACKLFWNIEPMGSTFGYICRKVFDRNPADLGRSVMRMPERNSDTALLQESLRDPLTSHALIESEHD